MISLDVLKVLPQYYFYISLGISLLIILFTLIFKKLFRKGILQLIKHIKFKSTSIFEDLNAALDKPLDYWITYTGLYVAILVSPFVTHPNKEPILLHLTDEFELSLAFISTQLIHQFYRVIIIVLLAWAASNLLSVYEKLFLNIGSRFNLLDNTVLIRFTVKVLKLAVIVLATILLIMQFVNLSAIIASVGLLGAAITFVAKDTLTNILSGIVLMVDNPFSIGDWVQVAGIEGIVEDVSFRSTRIRTFTQGVVVVPNSTLSSDNIINWSAMPKRRVSFDLGFTYETSKETLTKVVKEIEQYLAAHEQIENNTQLVYFKAFDSYALTIHVVYYSYITDFISFSKLKEEINLELMTIAQKEGADFAFPTQSIYIEKGKA